MLKKKPQPTEIYHRWGWGWVKQEGVRERRRGEGGRGTEKGGRGEVCVCGGGEIRELHSQVCVPNQTVEN